MDEFQKSNLKEYDDYELSARGFLCISDKQTKWAKKKANKIARKRLKEKVNDEWVYR